MPRAPRHLVELTVGVWLLIDLQRAWTPSLITILGQAASTPAWLLGLFAVAVVASPALLLRQVRRTAPTRRTVLAAWCLTGALLARGAVQVSEGGAPQLWAATAGVVLALTWLCLAARYPGPDLVAGVLVGLAVATWTHAALGSWGAVWRDDLWGWALLVVQVGGVGWVFATAGAAATPTGAAPRVLGFWLLPALLVAGIALANVGRASVAGGAFGAALVAGATTLAAGTALLPPALSRWRVLGFAVLAVGATAAALIGGTTYPEVDAAVGIIGLAGLLVVLATTPEVGRQPSRAHGAPERGLPGRDPMWAVWAGGLVWVFVFFVYYAGYDLGYRADWVVIALVAALGLAAVAGSWRQRVVTPRPAGSGSAARPRSARSARVARPAVTLVLVAATVGLAWVAPAITVRPVEVPEVDRDPGLTVLAWNLRMGYGIDGRFRVREVADLIAGEAPDVVLLSEVDRGWLLNGGQDQLEVLARLLDMEAHFGPAADGVWGDAILTALPVDRVESHALPSFGAPTGAQIMAATVTKQGHEYDVLSTHLQPTGSGPGGAVRQAERIAAFVRDRSVPGRPLVLGGDFNLTPGTEGFQAILDAGLDDALVDSRPLFTSPADAPEEQIDHLFVSRGTWVNAAWAVSTQLSDHFPVLVTIAAPRVA